MFQSTYFAALSICTGGNIHGGGGKATTGGGGNTSSDCGEGKPNVSYGLNNQSNATSRVFFFFFGCKVKK